MRRKLLKHSYMVSKSLVGKDIKIDYILSWKKKSNLKIMFYSTLISKDIKIDKKLQLNSCVMTEFSSVSLLGVDSFWGDCTIFSSRLGFIGTIHILRQIGGHSSRFVLFCSFWRLFTIKIIKSVKVFLFFFWKIIIIIKKILVLKIQTPGINMQYSGQVI